MTDEQIREFFKQNKPRTSDEGSFLAGLSSKMDAMSEIKRIQAEEHRHNCTVLLLVLIAGLMTGGAIMAFLLIRPTSPMYFLSNILSTAVSFWAEWKVTICIFAAAASIVLGIIPWRRDRSAGMWNS